MKVCGIFLILVGIAGFAMFTTGFGDIGLSFGLTGVAAILSGIVLLSANED